MNKAKITVDIVSDVVCPWCYIGKRRLEKAIASLNGEFDVELEYHPFELNPDMPISGVNQKEYLSEKFGGEERYEQITSHTTAVAGEDGLVFDFSKQQTSPNTRKAHALIKAAKESNKQIEVTEALFKAYFTDGINLSSDENLLDVVVAAGMNKSVAQAALTDASLNLVIAMEEQEMQKLGIRGVPFYIINKKYGVSGAQAPETFAKALRDINREMSLTGESCDVDAKNC